MRIIGVSLLVLFLVSLLACSVALVGCGKKGAPKVEVKSAPAGSPTTPPPGAGVMPGSKSPATAKMPPGK
jgi:hypothetical protein